MVNSKDPVNFFRQAVKKETRRLAREPFKIAKEIPLNQIVDWSLLNEIKAERDR